MFRAIQYPYYGQNNVFLLHPTSVLIDGQDNFTEKALNPPYVTEAWPIQA